MLKIHKPFSKNKLLLISITSICITSGLLGISLLTYTPELSHAETVVFPEKETRTMADITYMQDITPEICANTPEADTAGNNQYRLKDSRDQKSYWVAKLKDGNCWMTQNLDLDITTEGLKASDTDILEDWNSTTNPDYPPTKTQTGSPNGFNNTSNSKQKSNVVLSFNPGIKTCEPSAANCVTPSTALYKTTHYLQGNLYTFNAATAGKGASISTEGASVRNSSICPKNWQLPLNHHKNDTRSKSFYYLLSKYGLTSVNPGQDIGGITYSLSLSPLYFTYAGIIEDATLRNAGELSYYWSSTISNNNNAYAPGMSSSSVNIYNNPDRSSGFSVRCVASSSKMPTSTLSNATYMQEMTTGMCERSTEHESKQLIDSRDGKSYWVTKLKDGNCWMTQNLDLDITADGLRAFDTDIPVDWNNNSNYPPEETQKTLNPLFGTSTNSIKSWDPNQGGKPLYCSGDKCYSTSTASSNNGHDALGNYYSWGAATAGQAANITETNNATQSICPKNWTLPQNQASTPGTATTKSYRNLLNNYGWYWNQGNDPSKYSNNLTTEHDGITYSITGNPLYFVNGGWVKNDTFLKGVNGSYWSSTASYNSAQHAIINYSVYPSTVDNRFFGYSIRCVLREDVPDYNSNITIKINPIISLDVTGEVVERSDTNPSTADLNVKVSSNQPYSVSISSASPNMTSSTSDVVIPSKSGALTSSENAWGIKLSTASTYEQITTTPKLFYSSTSPESKSLPFTIGISTAPDIPNGEYSTNITITATQN